MPDEPKLDRGWPRWQGCFQQIQRIITNIVGETLRLGIERGYGASASAPRQQAEPCSGPGLRRADLPATALCLLDEIAGWLRVLDRYHRLDRTCRHLGKQARNINQSVGILGVANLACPIFPDKTSKHSCFNHKPNVFSSLSPPDIQCKATSFWWLLSWLTNLMPPTQY